MHYIWNIYYGYYPMDSINEVELASFDKYLIIFFFNKLKSNIFKTFKVKINHLEILINESFSFCF